MKYKILIESLLLFALSSILYGVISFSYLSLASHKRGIGGVWSESTLFALSSGISTKHDNNNN